VKIPGIATPVQTEIVMGTLRFAHPTELKIATESTEVTEREKRENLKLIGRSAPAGAIGARGW
jgi:hypothetical protein